MKLLYEPTDPTDIARAGPGPLGDDNPRTTGGPPFPVATTFNPLTDFSTDPVHGVWASDPLWVPPADGGAVSSWRNGGSVGGDLVQATGSKQPTYDAANPAYNNAAVVTFATDDVLAVDVADIAQPFYVLAIASVTSASGKDYVLGIGTFASFGLGDNETPAWQFRAGNTPTGGTPDSNAHLLRVVFDEASSIFDVDEGADEVSGNAGATGITVLSLGAGNGGVGTYGNYLNGSIAYVAVFDTDPTALPEWAAFKAWVTSTYGITVA